MTSTEELASLLALLKQEGLLTRATQLNTPLGVQLTLVAAPEPISPVARAEQEVTAEERRDERERLLQRGHVGGFRPKMPVFR